VLVWGKRRQFLIYLILNLFITVFKNGILRQNFQAVSLKKNYINIFKVVPNGKMSSCRDPELPGTGLQIEGGEGPSPLYSGEKSQLEPSRNGENVRRDREGLILDVMKEDLQPTE
jgi:hypothetical protein